MWADRKNEILVHEECKEGKKPFLLNGNYIELAKEKKRLVNPSSV